MMSFHEYDEINAKLQANQRKRIYLMNKATRCQRGSASWCAMRDEVARLREEAEVMIKQLKDGAPR